MTVTLTPKRGETFIRQFTYLDDEGAPIDITNHTILMSMEREGAWYDFTTVKTDAVNGVWTVTVPAAQSKLWQPEPYECDIDYVLSGVVETTDHYIIHPDRDITNHRIL
jgi:hypothetical protein